MTIAQDPKTAKHWDMPKNAIASGAVDLILPPGEIAHELVRISKHPYIADACESQPEAQAEFDEKIDDKEEIETESIEALRKIFSILKINTQVDFSNYKHATLKRRILRRMAVRRTDTLEAYTKFLRENDDEIKSLYNDILINVTEFFRDPESYKALAEHVFPQLIKKRDPDSPIRIWVAACATGEEAYSIAILIAEFLAEAGSRIPIQIFATDISEPCLQKARVGLYSESNLRGVSKERIKRFFEKVDGGYKINKSIRQLCLFSRHDLNADPAFGKLDLVSCRNILIYFAPILQKRIISIFHYALKLDGFLWLGKSEGTSGATKLFTVVDQKHKIYSKNNVSTPMNFRFPISANIPEVQQASPVSRESRKESGDFQRDVDRISLSKYAPPSVVVNAEMEILQFRGQTSAYLQNPPGPPVNNLFKMAMPGLLHGLRTALHEAKAQNRQARHECEIVDLNGNEGTVSIEVVPANPHVPPGQRKFVVFFEKGPSNSQPEKNKGARRNSEVEKKKSTPNQQDHRISRLEQEASASKLYQQSIIEDFEATREELTAGNEELQSTNEELQSTNEELETAKEEVQSSNEELTTVNDELQHRNAELTAFMSDLNNILTSVDVPLVIVGGDHCIRRFTPQAEKVFKLISSDIGRQLGDIKASFDLDLDGLVTEVIGSLVTQEREIQDHDGHWRKLQIRPFKTVDNKIDGAVIAFTDIDAYKRNLDNSEASLYYATSVADTVQLPFVVLGSHLLVQSANLSFYKYFNIPKEKIKFSLLEVLGIQRDQMHELTAAMKEALASKVPFNKIEINYESETLGSRHLLLSGRQIHWIRTESKAVLVALEDITEQKLISEKLHESEVTFRLLADSLPHLIWTANSDGVATWYNQRWYDYTGKTPDEMKGLAWRKDIHHPDHIERIMSFESQAWKKGEPWELTFPLKSKSGEWRLFLTRAVPVRNSAGKLERWIGTCTEINAKI